MLRSENRPSLAFVDVVPEADPPAEVAVAFELDRLVSEQVWEAVAEGEFPLVLSGNCNTSIGTLAGVGPEGLGVVWFDAHADFNTPETTTTGFMDGMDLAIAVGHCWKRMAEGVPGFFAVEEENAVLAGARALELPEEERLGASGVAVVGADRIRREGLHALAVVLDGLRERVGRVYVHLDLDVLDPAEVGRANGSAPEGGLTAGDLETALGMARERFSVAMAGIASYDPSFDADGRVLAAALMCVGILAAPDGQPGTVGVARAIFPAKIRPGAGLQGIEVREQRLLQGPRTPEAHGVLVQPECLEPTSRAQRLLQPEELELRRPVGPRSLATVASRA